MSQLFLQSKTMEKIEIKKIIKNEVSPYLIGLRNEVKQTNELLDILDGTLKDSLAEVYKQYAETFEVRGKEIEESNKKQIDIKVEIKGDEIEQRLTGNIAKVLREKLPKKGKNYFTQREIIDFKKAVTPKFGVDYKNGDDGKTPVKGKDYFTEKERAEFLKAVTPVKGIHYKDGAPGVPGKNGKNGTEISAEEIRNRLETLRGKNRLSISAIKDLEERLKNLEVHQGGPVGLGGNQNSGTATGDMLQSVYDPAHGNRQVAFYNQIPVVIPAKIPIPKLEFAIPNNGEPFLATGTPQGHPDNTVWNFHVYHFPTHDDRFLNYNPVIELMRYKRKNRKYDSFGNKFNQKNIFVHPTNRNGVDLTGSCYGGGYQKDSDGAPMPDRRTEWQYNPSSNAFGKVYISFDIAEWKGSNSDLASTGGGIPLPMTLNDWNTGSSMYTHSTGQGKSKIHKTDVFAFRLRINNPSVSTEPQKPFIFGQMSEPFKVYPKLGNVSTLGVAFYGWKVTKWNYPKSKS